MIFSENRFHFPNSALADVARAREGGANANMNRALWPQLVDEGGLMKQGPFLTGMFAVDDSCG